MPKLKGQFSRAALFLVFVLYCSYCPEETTLLPFGSYERFGQVFHTFWMDVWYVYPSSRFGKHSCRSPVCSGLSVARVINNWFDMNSATLCRHHCWALCMAVVRLLAALHSRNFIVSPFDSQEPRDRRPWKSTLWRLPLCLWWYFFTLLF